MRKHYLLLIAIMVSLSGFSQTLLPIDTTTNQVTFRQIIVLDSTYKAEKIYTIVTEWFSSNTKTFNRSNSEKNYQTGDILLGIQRGNSTELDQLFKIDQPLKFQSPNEKKLTGQGLLKYTGGSMGCIRVMYIEFDIKVSIKDYRLRLDLTNLHYTHFNQMSMQQSQIYGTEKGPCNSKNTIENLLNCERCLGEFEKFYTYLTSDMKNISDDLTKFLLNNKVEEDKW